MAAGAWIGNMRQVGTGNPEAAGVALERLDRALSVYERLDCPQELLLRSIECLSELAATGQVRGKAMPEIEQMCMSGFAMLGTMERPEAAAASSTE